MASDEVKNINVMS